jgi:hypothetical protein
MLTRYLDCLRPNSKADKRLYGLCVVSKDLVSTKQSRARLQDRQMQVDLRRGSIKEVGWRFQSFGINDLEMVAQICPRWNPLTSWMRQIEDFQRAA